MVGSGAQCEAIRSFLLCADVPFFMPVSSSFSKRLSFFFFVLTVVELTLLPALARFDAGFARWIDSERSCGFDYVMFVVKDRPLFLLEAFGGFILLLLCLRGRWREARHLLLVVIVGGFLCELLKTGLERPRPSVLSEVVTGNSFPSGHVTTALLVAGALGRLLLQGENLKLPAIKRLLKLTGQIAILWWNRQVK